MYYKMDLDDCELIEKVIEITGIDYELLGDFIPVESLLHAIEDLYCEVESQKEKLEDLENDLKENYRPIPVSEQYGISDKDFI